MSLSVTNVRVSRWIKTDTMTEQFGVEMQANGKWHHLAIDGEAALFDTEGAASTRVKAIRNQIVVAKKAAT